MNVNVLVILIVSSICLYWVKYLKELYDTDMLMRKLEQLTKIALRVSLIGIVAVGLAFVAILIFPIFRQIGFALLSSQFIDFIRLILELLLETRSVYAALHVFMGISLTLMEFALIFSIFGLFVTKRITLPRVTRAHLVEYITRCKEKVGEYCLCRREKIFLHFANLRI